MGIEKQSKLLRSFHNKVKNFLITAYGSNAPLLFDIGVGRGGDVFKWCRSNVQKCYGYDIDELSVREANRRLQQCDGNKHCEYHLFTLPRLRDFKTKLNSISPGLKANVISCQFAIHYFFGSCSTASELMSFVNESLSDHGYFIGTFMRGEAIVQLTDDLQNTYSNQQMIIDPKSSIVSDFGTLVDVFLTNTLYFGDKSVSSEYLVNSDTLVDIAKQHGLKLIQLTSFEDHYKNFNVRLEDDVKKCSFMYSSFVFQKI